MHAHGFGGIIRFQPKGIVAQILAGLDIVLVPIGPVEFDFFAFVGDRVDTRPIDALGQEVAFRIVAAEKAEQMVVDLVLKPANIDSVISELSAQFLDLR